MKREQSEGHTRTLIHTQTHIHSYAEQIDTHTLPAKLDVYIHTHTGQCSVHCDTQQRNGAEENFLMDMRQPAVLAGARGERRQGKSMGLMRSNMYTHTHRGHTHIDYLCTS